MYKFNTIEEAISDIKDGKIIIVVDNPERGSANGSRKGYRWSHKFYG